MQTYSNFFLRNGYLGYFLINIGLEAMKKLGVKADVGKDMRALFQGDSTQVPMLPVVNIGKARVSRKISLGNRALIYEKN